MCMPTNQNTCNLYTIEFGTSDTGDPHMHSCIIKKTAQNRPSIECKGNEYQTHMTTTITNPNIRRHGQHSKA